MKIIANNYKANEIIRFIRENVDLTQEEFGEKLKKNKRTIRRYERGELNYSFKYLIEIANLLDLIIYIKNKKFQIITNNYETNELIKMIREKYSLSLETLANKMGKSISAIKNYEYNHRNYNFIFLLDLAHKLDFNIIIEDKK